jgi:Fe-S cluster assembly ATP-binding protein
MIQLKNISLRLGEGPEQLAILTNISLTFENGKLYVITGPNGGGKTSVAKVMMGIYQPASGKVYDDGADITQLSIAERAQRGIRYAFQTPPRFKGIAIDHFLRLSSPETGEAQIYSYMRQIGLCPKDYLDRPVDSGLSGGEMKRVEVASVLLGPSRVAILDEPEAGVDLWGFDEMLRMILRSHSQAKERITIIISHSEKFLEAADEIIIMAQGLVQERGKITKIRPLIDEGIRCRWRKVCMEGDGLDEIQCSR